MKKVLVIGIVIAVMMTMMVGVSGCNSRKYFKGFNHGYDMEYNCIRDHWECYTTECNKNSGTWFNRHPGQLWFNFKVVI